MDWFSWLSKANLDPSLVYEYGITFTQNELGENDIPYFNHEFLQSMGISIAKHRLEILKIAIKDEVSNYPHPLPKVLIAIKRTKRYVFKYLARWKRRQESALVLVPQQNHSAQWKNVMVKRSKRLFAGADKNIRPPLLLTNGSPYKLLSIPKIDSFWDPLMDEIENNDQKRDDNNGDDERWSCGVEEIRWDAMFVNLKPT